MLCCSHVVTKIYRSLAHGVNQGSTSLARLCPNRNQRLIWHFASQTLRDPQLRTVAQSSAPTAKITSKRPKPLSPSLRLSVLLPNASAAPITSSAHRYLRFIRSPSFRLFQSPTNAAHAVPSPRLPFKREQTRALFNDICSSSLHMLYHHCDCRSFLPLRRSRTP